MTDRGEASFHEDIVEGEIIESDAPQTDLAPAPGTPTGPEIVIADGNVANADLQQPTDANDAVPPAVGQAEPPKKAAFLMTAEEKLAEKQRQQGEALKAKKPEDKKPGDQIKEFGLDGNFKFQKGVQGELLMMDRYNVISNAARVAELATMTLEQLQEQPEYLAMQVRNLEDERQRPDMMGAEYVMKLVPELEELKKQYEGLSVDDAMKMMEDTEFEKLKAEYLEKAKAEANLAEGEELTEEQLAEMEAAAEKNARYDAETKKNKFLANAALMVGDFVFNSINESDFGTFLDNFFTQAAARGNSWSRYRENFADKGKNGEMIFPGQVLEHFKSKEDLVKTLNFFYEEAEHAQAEGHLMGFEKPEGLKEAFAAGDVTDEVIQEIFQHLAKELKEEEGRGESHVFDVFEKAALKSMGKSSETAMLDGRIIDNLIKIGDVDRTDEFAEFAARYNKK
jgi:hypothetical protein